MSARRNTRRAEAGATDRRELSTHGGSTSGLYLMTRIVNGGRRSANYGAGGMSGSSVTEIV
jgi:hypothetical protein